MMRFPVVGLLTMILLAPAVAQDPDPEIARLLRDLRNPDERETFVAAAEALAKRGPDARAARQEVLLSLLAKGGAEVRKACDLICELGAAIEGSPALDEAVARWSKLRTHALEWILDPVKFPYPKITPVRGPEEGYGEALARGNAASAAYGELEPRLDRDIQRSVRLGRRKAKALRAAHSRAAARYRLVAETLSGEPWAGETPEPDALSRVLLATAEGRYDDAVKAMPAIAPGWRRLVAFHAYGSAIRARNAREPCGMAEPTVRGVDLLNRYRMHLGHSPLWHNAKLVRTAQGHATEMMELGYFAHDSPVAKNLSPGLRGRNEGYRGQVTENCYGGSSAATAFEKWKWDGGHHRPMVSRHWREVGCSSKGPCTLNPGSGEPGCPPFVEY